MSKLKGEIIVNLIEELWHLPEYKTYQALRSLDISIHTFQRNHEVLITLLSFLSQNTRPPSLIAARNHDKLTSFGKEIVWGIHNYVAAGMSILDHTEKLKDIKKFPDYWSKRDAEFEKDPFASFVKGLREYCQHHRSPNLTLTTAFLNDTPVTKAKIALSDLRTYRGWKAKAKEYLNTFDAEVDIQDVVTMYSDKIMHFCKWFQERQCEIYANEIEICIKKDTELQLLKIEDQIDSYVPFIDNYPVSKHDIFLSVFTSEDFDKLEQPSLSIADQAELAIKILEEYFPVPEKIKQKIISFYSTVNNNI